jgi:hypothetical protein
MPAGGARDAPQGAPIVIGTNSHRRSTVSLLALARLRKDDFRYQQIADEFMLTATDSSHLKAN